MGASIRKEKIFKDLSLTFKRQRWTFWSYKAIKRLQKRPKKKKDI